MKRMLEITHFFAVEEYAKNNSIVIAGADEAGRGPLAGPVVAAAVIMRDIVAGVDDSKKLSEKKREMLYDAVTSGSAAYAVGIVDEQEIDKINILNAARKAFYLAVSGLAVRPEFVVNDEIKGLELGVENMSIVKGDAKVYSIAAASIIAKVTRDKIMREYDAIYPEYNFKKHKGYGTKEHRDAILKFGPCPIHRRTFLRNILGDAT